MIGERPLSGLACLAPAPGGGNREGASAAEDGQPAQSQQERDPVGAAGGRLARGRKSYRT